MLSPADRRARQAWISASPSFRGFDGRTGGRISTPAATSTRLTRVAVHPEIPADRLERLTRPVPANRQLDLTGTQLRAATTL